MRRAGWLLISIVAISLGVVVSSSPVAACSCEATTDRAAFASADVVFVGTPLQHIEEAPPFRDAAGRLVVLVGGDMTVRFRLDQSLKGPAADTHDVKTSSDESSCGVPTRIGASYLVFARAAPDGTLSMNSCGPTRVLADGNVPADLVPPEPVLPSGLLHPGRRAAGDVAVPGAVALGALGAVGALAAAAAGLWTRRRRTRVSS